MILDSALQMVDRLDPGHADRVARLVYDLSLSYGLDENDSRLISRCSRYHDIGKIAVPKFLLKKQGPLSEAEMNNIRKHVLYGLMIAAHLTGKEAEVTKTIIATHHEHWDGNGYPHRLKGENIPLCGRIVAICDTYDAMTSNRPYRAAWTPRKAAEYIRERSGIQFDPKLVEPFLRMVMEPAGGFG